jgi:hypothetical protein
MTLQLRYLDARLDDAFQVVDTLHDAATEGELEHVTTLRRAELVNWLRELIFTAQETIAELEDDAAPVTAKPMLRVLPRASGGER